MLKSEESPRLIPPKSEVVIGCGKRYDKELM